MSMELKVIIYVLIAIGYFVHNNYKKIVSENKKRVFGQPETAAGAQPPAAVPAPRPAAPTQNRKQFRKLNTEKKTVAVKKPVPVFKRKEFVDAPFSYENSMPEVLVSANPILPLEIINVKNTQSKLSKPLLRSAILYGEIINKPLWSKY